MCAPQQNGRVCKAWSKPSPTRFAGKTRPCTTRHCSMVTREPQPDESSNDPGVVRRRCAAPGQLSAGPGYLARIAGAGGRPTIPATGLSCSRTAGLPCSSGAAGLPWPGIRRTNRPAAAATGNGPTAAGGCDGVDAGLLELGRPRLGVGTGQLCGSSLPSRRLGSGPLAPTGAKLGLGSGTLAGVEVRDH